MTIVKDRIIQRMIELAADPANPWEAIPSRPGAGATVRRMWEERTPDYVGQQWPAPTYHRLVFLSLCSGRFLLGTCAAPWVARQDTWVPLWLVAEILEDPELALDTERKLALKAARPARGGTGRGSPR
jgi:hypothetical protein